MDKSEEVFIDQVKIYVGKCLRLFKNEKQWKNLISTLIITLIICLVTSSDMFVEYKDTKNGCFAVVCACIWTGLFNSIRSICKERAIIKREHRSGMRIDSYLTAHAVYEFGLCVAEAVIVLVVVYIKNIGHLPPNGLIGWAFTDMFVTILLAIFCSDMLALLISCAVKDENAAMTVMPFVLVVQLVMSGTIFELEGFTNIISKLTVSKWALDAMCGIAGTDDNVYTGSWLNGADLITEGWPLFKIWLVLIAFAVIYVFVGIFLLKNVDNDQR